MRSMKKLGVLVAVFALCAIGAANASAATKFTASNANGTLSGKALATQVFHTNAGNVECNKADISGTIPATESEQQEAIVTYTECNAFGLTVHITPEIHYLFTANGGVHLETKVTLTVTGGLLLGECTITIEKGQWLTGVTYTNNGTKLKVTPNPVKGIVYSSTGGVCGSSGTNGEYSGASEVEEVGGTVSVD